MRETGFEILFMLIFGCLVTVAVAVTGCETYSPILETVDGKRTLDCQTIEHDGCEYLVIQSPTDCGYNVQSITHKGNCKQCKKQEAK